MFLLKYEMKKKTDNRKDITAADNDINHPAFFLSPKNGIKTAETSKGRIIKYSISTFVPPQL